MRLQSAITMEAQRLNRCAERDRAGAPGVVIINETMARRLFFSPATTEVPGSS